MAQAVILAASSLPAGIDIASFLQFGILGLIFVLIIMKKFIVPEWTLAQVQEQHASEIKLKQEQIDALMADKKELKETVDQLQSLTRDQMIPALVRANQLSADYVAELAVRERNARQS